MKRLAIVSALALAAVLPTALVLSTHASRRAPEAQPGLYSVRQVIAVFRAHGIRLHRTADGEEPNQGYESFSAPVVRQLSVDVWAPASARAMQFASSCMGWVFPQLASQGNVQVTRCDRAAGDRRRIEAALHQLRYSAADAVRPQLPTIVLHAGQRRVINLERTVPGTAVDCSHAFQVASVVVHRAMRSSSVGVFAGGGENAVLSWVPVSRSSLSFACGA